MQAAMEMPMSQRQDSNVEKPAAPSDKDLSQTASVVQQSLRSLASGSAVTDAENAAKQAHAARSRSRIRAIYKPQDQPTIIKAFVQGKLVDAFIALWNVKNSVDLHDEKNPQVLAYRDTLACLWNLTDISMEVCEESIGKQVIELILTDLRKPEFLETRQGKESTVLFYLMSGYLGVLNNFANLVPQCSTVICAADGINVIRQYLETKFHKPKTKAIFLLSLLLTDDKKNELASILNKSNVSYLLKILDEALKQPNHFNKVYGYTAEELLRSIGRVSTYSEHFSTILIDSGYLDTVHELLLAPDAEQVSSSNAKVKFSTAEEKTVACSCLWSFTFYPKCREALRAKQALGSTLQKLAEDGDAELKRNAGGVLWDLRRPRGPDAERPASGQLRRQKKAPAKLSGPVAAGPLGPPSTPPTESHVMLSYNWASQSEVKKIAKFLQSHGVKTWMDVEDMAHSTVEAMALAVENASAIIICYSQEYLRSPNCRAEAEYAFQLKKSIIPARMQNFQASGWLGFILGAKLWYDFSDKKLFDQSLSKLVACLRRDAVDGGETVPKLALENLESEPAFMPMGMPPPPPGNGNPYQALLTWSAADVQKWLAENGLEKHKSKFTTVDGVLLHEMVLMDMRTPAFLYEQLKVDLKLDFLAVLTFIHALHSLVEKFPY